MAAGLDGHVHVVDFHHGDLDGLASILVTKELSEIIGSVRWHPTGLLTVAGAEEVYM